MKVGKKKKRRNSKTITPNQYFYCVENCPFRLASERFSFVIEFIVFPEMCWHFFFYYSINA